MGENKKNLEKLDSNKSAIGGTRGCVIKRFSVLDLFSDSFKINLSHTAGALGRELSQINFSMGSIYDRFFKSPLF